MPIQGGKENLPPRIEITARFNISNLKRDRKIVSRTVSELEMSEQGVFYWSAATWP